MRFISILLVLFFICFKSHSQHFLASKSGEYKGYLKLCSYGNACDSIPFSYIIQTTSDPTRMKTKTVYFPKNNPPITKDYDLFRDTTFADFEHYILDENDGILIIETLQGNTLHSSYSVDDNFYTIRTSYFEDYIDYELVVYNQKTRKVSASLPDEENKVFTVETFPFVTVQRGKLYKTNQ